MARRFSSIQEASLKDTKLLDFYAGAYKCKTCVELFQNVERPSKSYSMLLVTVRYSLAVFFSDHIQKCLPAHEMRPVLRVLHLQPINRDLMKRPVILTSSPKERIFISCTEAVV